MGSWRGTVFCRVELATRLWCSGGLLVLLQLQSGNLIAMHFVRTIGATQRTRLSIGTGQTEVSTDAPTAVHLHGPVDYLQCHIWCGDFDHGDFFTRDFVARRIHHVCGFEDQKSSLVDKNARFGDTLLCHCL